MIPEISPCAATSGRQDELQARLPGCNCIRAKIISCSSTSLAGYNRSARLSVTGFFRYQLSVHTGVKNPAINLHDNNDFNLSRTFFQTEWTYQPAEHFRLFAKVRVLGDQTYHMDDELDEYDAFPIDVPKYDWTMMKASNDDFRAEVWELYVDLNLRDLWLRIGRQQISWGEMIGGRILDAVNSLDRSWNFLFEPEEFENIRIPSNVAYYIASRVKSNIRELEGCLIRLLAMSSLSGEDVTEQLTEAVLKDLLNHGGKVTKEMILRNVVDEFGFTEAEVKRLLEYFELEERLEGVKEWYNGYIFGKAHDIYNPWSILKYVQEGAELFKPYWLNTSGNVWIKWHI